MSSRNKALPACVLFLGVAWCWAGVAHGGEPGSVSANVPAQTAVATDPAGDEGWDEDFDDFDDFEDAFEDEGEIIPDPLEPLNRLVFAFNDKLYFYLLKPIARGWRVLPTPMRSSISRFYANLRAPIRFVNNGLQLKFRASGIVALRFGINSTIGVLGLFDPAQSIWGLRKQEEDFGQTLGHYGLGHGFYIVWPIWGPSSLRDSVGLTVDSLYLDPTTVLIRDPAASAAAWGVDMINYLSLDKDTYEGIKRDALDPYNFLKNAYAQNRDSRVRR